MYLLLLRVRVCRDGVCQSGLFVTVSCIWERLKDRGGRVPDCQTAALSPPTNHHQLGLSQPVGVCCCYIHTAITHKQTPSHRYSNNRKMATRK